MTTWFPNLCKQLSVCFLINARTKHDHRQHFWGPVFLDLSLSFASLNLDSGNHHKVLLLLLMLNSFSYHSTSIPRAGPAAFHSGAIKHMKTDSRVNWWAIWISKSIWGAWMWEGDSAVSGGFIYNDLITSTLLFIWVYPRGGNEGRVAAEWMYHLPQHYRIFFKKRGPWMKSCSNGWYQLVDTF